MKKPKKYNHLGHLLCLAFGVKSCQVLRIEAHYAKGIKLEAIVLPTPKRRTASGRTVLRHHVTKTIGLTNGWPVRRLRKLLS